MGWLWFQVRFNQFKHQLLHSDQFWKIRRLSVSMWAALLHLDIAGPTEHQIPFEARKYLPWLKCEYFYKT